MLISSGELPLYLLLIVAAVVVTQLEDLFAAAMLTGIFSLIIAGLYLLMDAVDVAFTEAAVGAVISTVLMLGTLALTSRRERQQKFRLLPVLIVVTTGAALIYGTFDMPLYGDPAAPINQHVAPEYLARTAEEIEVPNVVTAVLASYRGYDTLGETMVIFTAGVGVLLLLGSWRKTRGEDEP